MIVGPERSVIVAATGQEGPRNSSHLPVLPPVSRAGVAMSLDSFVAVDVETANHNRGSICQIATVEFQHGEIASEWCTLVDPDESFSSANIAVHGIQACDVIGHPTIGELSNELHMRLRNRLVVSHTLFDQQSLSLACPQIVDGLEWLDTCAAARTAWPELPTHRLSYLAQQLQIEFQHHDALHDARAAGMVLLAACRRNRSLLRTTVTTVAQRHRPSRRFGPKVKRSGDPNGRLSGEVVVLTGTMWTGRNRVADLAASAGCDVRSEITKSTTILVQGMDKIGQSKVRKAKSLIRDGQRLRILNDSEFRRLLESAMCDDNCSQR
jgi:DNA polymerase-3 subunit epsilon